jgi:hypothetical protein
MISTRLSRLLGRLVLLGLTALVAPLVASERRCEPVDEAVRQPDFFTFRAQLQSAVARRDTDAVLAAIDPRIRIGFGDKNGIEAFTRQWRLHEPDSQLWAELGAVLALGGSFNDAGAFVAPYVFSSCKVDDAYEDVAVVGVNVRVREKPSSDAPVVATVSFAVVKRASVPKSGEWTRITLGDGRQGFIASNFVRSPIDYRAFFSRANGGWRMTLFLAGD